MGVPRPHIVTAQSEYGRIDRLLHVLPLLPVLNDVVGSADGLEAVVVDDGLTQLGPRLRRHHLALGGQHRLNAGAMLRSQPVGHIVHGQPFRASGTTLSSAGVPRSSRAARCKASEWSPIVALYDFSIIGTLVS